MSTLAERFAAAVDVALALDTPAQIRDRIDAHVDLDADDGLRSATFDARVRGGARTSHPERMLGLAGWDSDEPDDEVSAPTPRPFWSANSDDRLAVSNLERQFITSVRMLVQVCRGSVYAKTSTWGEAIKDGRMLAEGRIADAIRLEFPVAQWCEETISATNSLRRISRRYEPLGRAPSQHAADHTSKWCKNHMRLGLRKERYSRALCRWCWRNIEDLEPLGDPVGLQLDPLLWPTDEMIRAHEDERQRDVSMHRRDWLVSLGLDPLQVHNRRQRRRSA